MTTWSEDPKAYQAKYFKANYKQFGIALRRGKEDDIIEYVEKMPNRRRWFIKKVREEMRGE